MCWVTSRLTESVDLECVSWPGKCCGFRSRLAKVCGGQGVKALASSFGISSSSRRGCLLPSWRLAFIWCAPPIFVHWIHIHVSDSDCPKGAFSFVDLAWKLSDLLWLLRICKVELSNCCYPAAKTSMLQLCWIVDAAAGLHNQTSRCQTS